jgi:hypothetical protein
MPLAVGHNIVPLKQANKGNTVAPAEPVEFAAKDVTKRNTLENATGRTQLRKPVLIALNGVRRIVRFGGRLKVGARLAMR